MAYYPASNVRPYRASGRTATRMSRYISKFGTVSCIKGYDESQGEKNLKRFADALVQMKIGTPVSENNDMFNYIVAFLRKNSELFRTSLFNRELGNNRYIEFEANMMANFDGMPVTYIIDADALQE